MMKKQGMIRKTVLLSSLLLLSTSCQQNAAADPSGSAVSFPQMHDFNSSLKETAVDDAYRNTYEVFLRSYYDSDHDGIGDLKGLQTKLDEIRDMGFTEIWLMPICPSDTYHKYDVKDYMAIDPQYGTMEDYDSLVKACHERGIRVITDLVLNHTAFGHEWFQNAWAYLKELPEDWQPSTDYCPYFDYYHFSREFQSGYEKLPDTNWYYEARFWDQMPDLNLDSEQVRNEIVSIMKFWLEHGTDGFRLDAVTSYYTGDPEKNTAFLKWLSEEGKKLNPDCYFVGEAWTNKDEIAVLYQSGIDSLFAFPFADAEGVIKKTAAGIIGADDYVTSMISCEQAWQQANPAYVNAPFYTNHDMGRSAGYYAGDDGSRTKLAGALNILMNGNVFVYYGEEIGMKGAGRDENKRAPMYWSKDAAEGMCDPPEGMDDIEMKFDPYDVQKDDPYSILNYYREALKIRNAFPVIARGETVAVDAVMEEEIAAFIRHHEQYDDVMIIINTSENEETVSLNELPFHELKAVLNTGADEVRIDNEELILPPFGIAVMTK